MKRILFLLSIALTVQLPAKTVYIVPFEGSDPQKSFYEPYSSRDEVAKPLCCLREGLEKAGYKVRFTWDAWRLIDVKAIISLNGCSETLLQNLKKYPRKRCFLLGFEPPIVQRDLYSKSLIKYYGKIFVMFDDLVDSKNYFKFCFPQPRREMVENIPDYAEKKLCVMIAGNKDYGSSDPRALYGERRKWVAFSINLDEGEFDLFGSGWEGFSSWRGMVSSKWETLKNYRFCICYENMKDQKGYITEKIFDCFIGGCVPVYWGASNIGDYVFKDCFIDRRNFSSDEELYRYLKNIDREAYEGYIDAMKRYLKSPEAHKFSTEAFVKTLLDHIEKI